MGIIGGTRGKCMGRGGRGACWRVMRRDGIDIYEMSAPIIKCLRNDITNAGSRH